jgi:hypothetical protein
MMVVSVSPAQLKACVNLGVGIERKAAADDPQGAHRALAATAGLS